MRTELLNHYFTEYRHWLREARKDQDANRKYNNSMSRYLLLVSLDMAAFYRGMILKRK